MAGCSSFLQPTHLWERGEGGGAQVGLWRGSPKALFVVLKFSGAGEGDGDGQGSGAASAALPRLQLRLQDSSSSGAFPRSYSLLTPRISSLIGLIAKRLCPKKKKWNKTQNPLAESTASLCLPLCAPQKSHSRLWLACPFPFPCLPFPLQAVPCCSPPPPRSQRGGERIRAGVGRLRGRSISQLW